MNVDQIEIGSTFTLFQDVFNRNEYWADKYKRNVVLYGGGSTGGGGAFFWSKLRPRGPKTFFGETPLGSRRGTGGRKGKVGVIKGWKVGEKREIMKQCLTFCNIMKKG